MDEVVVVISYFGVLMQDDQDVWMDVLFWLNQMIVVQCQIVLVSLVKCLIFEVWFVFCINVLNVFELLVVMQEFYCGDVGYVVDCVVWLCNLGVSFSV